MRTGEGSCEEGSSLEASLPEESVIVISDDEGEVSALGNSVLLIEEAAEKIFTPEKRKLEVLDDELAITYSKKAHVMPHARYDCTSHPFVRMEQETSIPLEENASFCDECYCYLCDKLASECSSWTCPTDCHCNAHNKSKYWKMQRDTALAGVLTMFQLDLTEIDAELREGGNQLQVFLSELSQVQQKYREGVLMTYEDRVRCSCGCHSDKNPKCNLCIVAHKPMRVHSYLPVKELVTRCVNNAENEHPRTAAVILLGVAKEILMETVFINPYPFYDAATSAIDAAVTLMSRVVSTLQRLLVLADFPRNLYEKFIMFFQSISIPRHCHMFINCLNVLRWDNFFLSSVLAGQNLAGARTVKGKREYLCEALPVVQSRVERLEMDQCYRQLVRYLNAVRCPDQAGLNLLKQKMAFYMCKFGDFPAAAHFLVQTRGMPHPIARHLTAEQYELYLTMLRTRSCPPGSKLVERDVWIPCEGPSLKTGALLRTAIRILFCNPVLQYQPKCWSSLVRVWSTCDHVSEDGKLVPKTVPEPDRPSQMMTLGVSCSILDELQRQLNVHLPPQFHKPTTAAAAEFIVIVQAVIRFMMSSARPLPPLLEFVFAFGYNIWPLALLMESISPMQELLFSFMASIDKDLQDNEQRVLNTLNTRGPHYTANLISVFMLHGYETVRCFALHMIDILIKNMTRYNWTLIVGNSLKNKLVSMNPRMCFSDQQLHQLRSKLGKLSSKK